MSGQQEPERIGKSMRSIKKLARKNKLKGWLKYFHLIRQAQDQARQVGDLSGRRLLIVESKRIRGEYLFLESMGRAN